VQWQYNPPLQFGAAIPGQDFTDRASHVVHFNAGQADADVVFHTTVDGVNEGPLGQPGVEAFALIVSPGQTGIIGVLDTSHHTNPTQANIGHIADPGFVII